jgi:hypothetical protein
MNRKEIDRERERARERAREREERMRGRGRETWEISLPPHRKESRKCGRNVVLGLCFRWRGFIEGRATMGLITPRVVI